MLLVVDNSNHTTKLALSGGTGWVGDWRARLPSADLSAEAMLRALPDRQAIHRIASASVTSHGPEILDNLAAMLGVPHFPLSAASTPLDFGGYAAPETIGADRLANAVAATTRFPGRDVIAIDAGTAITFTVVRGEDDKPARFLGGAIAPGLGVLAHWPAGRTARLPAPDFPTTAPSAIGAGTTEALAAATWFGARGLVRSIVAEQCHALGREPVVVLTGSDAPRLEGWLDGPTVVDPWLTLEGIRLCATRPERG